jgi:hypothetical protein
LFLKRRDPALNDPASGTSLSFFAVAPKRPSVDRSTGVIAFINSDNALCFINSAGGRRENCLNLRSQVHSVAMSADGQKFAFVFRDAFGQPENQISIVDLATDAPTQEIDLVAPATEGASTATIDHADAMDFSNDGQFLIYDAFNNITLADGTTIGVWSIYSLDLINQTITALVPPVTGFHFAFPSLSKTTDDFLVFDAFNLNTGTNTVSTASLLTGKIQAISTSDDFGTPSYVGDDSAIVFSKVDLAAATKFSLYKRGLEADHISPSGASQLWIRDADYGVIYRRGTVSTTPAPTQPLAIKEGLWWIPDKPGSGFDIGINSNNDLYMVWYTYTPKGRSIWYLASGALNGNNWNADVVEYTWDGSTAIPRRVGDATLNFQNDNHATLNWTLNTGNGSTEIEYFVFDSGSDVSAGTWFEAAKPGYGLTQVNQGATQVKVLYFYGQAGNPRWVLGSGTSSAVTTAMDTFNGTCPVCPYQASVASAAGTVTTTFADQTSGTLSTDIVLPSPLFGSWQIFDALISNLSE